MQHVKALLFVVVCSWFAACNRGAASNDGDGASRADLACAPEDDAMLCAAAARECGSRWQLDRCGGNRVVDCGVCSGLAICDDTTARCVTPATAACDGAGWCTEQSPTLAGSARVLSDGRSGQLWVGGAGLHRVDGAAMKTIIPASDAYEIVGLYSPAIDEVWAIASNATLLHCTPNTTTCATLATETQLHGVYGANAGEVYFVGDGGLGLVWNGEQLIKLATYTEENLVAVDGSPEGDVWTISEQGRVWRRINVYSSMPKPPTGRVVGVATFGLEQSYVATWDEAAPTATAFQVWKLVKGEWKSSRTIADVAVDGAGNRALKKGADGRLYVLTLDGVMDETGALAARLGLNDVQIASDGSLRALSDNFALAVHPPMGGN